MEYFLISQLSAIIRRFIENPLESLISYNNLTFERFTWIIFILQYWPMIMHTLTFGIVGTIYERGKLPALGSILYLLTYWVNSNILKALVSLLGTYGVSIVIISFLLICFLESMVMNKLRMNKTHLKNYI